MDDLLKNMTKGRRGGKHLWHGESACPHAAVTGRTSLIGGRLYAGCGNWDSLLPTGGRST
jgi:hypothetical protein